MLKIIHSIIFICAIAFTFGQNVKVSGKLFSTDSRPLNGEVKVVETGQSYLIDTDGFFSIQLKQNSNYNLVFSSINHFPKKIKVRTMTSNKNIGEIYLQLKSLSVVVVETEQQGITIDKIKPPNLGSMPSSTGNFEDYIKISALGVSSNNELTSNYNVRGGNYDENLIYVNGIEIYRPFLTRSGQQEGLSFINSAFVENIYFSAGGFDSYYGDKLSSVLDIEYKEPTSFGGSVQISLMGAQAHIEGVYGKARRGNYLTGARYRSNSYLLNGLPTQGDYNPTFFDYQFLTNYYTVYDNDNSYQKLYILGHFSTNNYKFIPSTRTTSFGTINEAYQFRVYFDGQESTSFRTFTGAVGYQWRVNKNLNMHFVTSSFHSDESENFDINGEYFINQLETDPAKEEFGDSTENVGIGGFLEHGRNNLNVWIANAYHYGKYEWNKNTHQNQKDYHFSSLRWGVKIQNEQFNDKLSEWRTIDSAGYAIPQGNDSTLELIDVVKATNYVNTQRFTSHLQYTINLIKKKDVYVDLKTKIKSDSAKSFIYKSDTILNSPSKLAFSIGERTGLRTFNNEFWFTPRMNISYFPRKYILNEDSSITRRNVKFKFSSGLYYQPPLYRDMRSFQGEIRNVVSQKSWHNVIGADVYFKMWGRPFKFITEAYYKYLWDVNPYEIDNVRIRYYADNNSIAYAYGIDAKINGEFINGIESSVKIGILQTKEDIQDDFYYTYFNSDGDTIYPGYTFNNVATDSTLNTPGYIPRPSEQLFTFGLYFQDHMPKYPNFKVSINLLFGSPLPYGPPTQERYKDVLRTKSYFRTDIGFIYDFINQSNVKKFEDKKVLNQFERLSASFSAFNLMGVKNIISYQWLQDISGNYYAIPNHLTGLRLNLRIVGEF